jgi:autotransporter-associated beta strand protein
METLDRLRAARQKHKQPAVAVVFLVLAFELVTTGSSRAGSATWKTVPVDNNWNNPLNWTPETVPMNEGDVATFAVSSVKDITTSAYVAVSSIVFEPGATEFTITPAADNLEIFSPGIVNDSGVLQTFVATVDGAGNAHAFPFIGSSTAGTNTMFITQARLTDSGDAGDVEFDGSASAGMALIVNQGGEADGSVGGHTRFFGRATAADAMIICNGGVMTGAGGGTIEFLGPTSHGGNAVLIANGGSNGGAGGQIVFYAASTGETARVEVFGNGSVSFAAVYQDASVGSLEGDGLVFLGERAFTIGGNNLSTTFSGVIQDTEVGPGPVTKVGTAILTLSGANTYSKDTIVTAGTLIIANRSGSGTGTGSVKVNAGTLGGSGIITGATTIGTGTGAGAFLAPAVGSTKQTTLTIQSALTLNSDATYTYSFKAKKNKSRADLVKANGVTINGATLNLAATTQGSLRQGLTLTLISNTSANPISGTFSNLPDGGIVTVNGNNLQASYHGGDGNDLTLTVVQ